MRLRKLLTTGLLLAALWGSSRTFTSTEAQPSGEPPRLPVDAAAQPLSNGQAQPDSNVRLASFTAAMPLLALALGQTGQSVHIQEIEDSDSGLVWSGQWLSDVWLKGSSLKLRLQLEGDVTQKDVYLVHGEERIPLDRITAPADTALHEISIELPGFVKGEVYVSVLSQNASFDVVLGKAPNANSPRLHLHRPSDLPLPPALSSLRLGSFYPVLEPTSDNQFTIFNRGKTLVDLTVECAPKTSELKLIEFETRTDGRKIVRDVKSLGNGAESQTVPVKLEINPSSTEVISSVGIQVVGATEAASTYTFANRPIELRVATQVQREPTPGMFVLSNILHGGNQATQQQTLPRPKFATTQQSGQLTAEVQCTYAPVDGAAFFAWGLFSRGHLCSELLLLKQETGNKVHFNLRSLEENDNDLEVRVFQGEKQIAAIPIGTLEVKTGGFYIEEIGPKSFGAQLGVGTIDVTFSRPPLLPSNSTESRDLIRNAVIIQRSTTGEYDPGSSTQNITIAEVQQHQQKLTIVPETPVQAGNYLVRVFGEQLHDAYGNALQSRDGRVGGIYEERLGGAADVAASLYPVTPGVTRGQAPIVTYPPFVEPTEQPTGFNPNDRVETRVARLYFYRDAHRVAQILNRKAQSYNRQDVAMRRQFADKARQEADSLTTIRQIAERHAVEMAHRTRELENQLSDAQRSMNFSLQKMQQVAVSTPPEGLTPSEFQDRQRLQLQQLETAARSTASQVEALQSQMRSARDAEVQANEQMQQAQRGEELARSEQFRLETAAAHADPDTFAPGDPASIDPVAQVSISVIGEGLLHLRGPLRGVNQVRIMIDQIDAPCGQVRVNIHSTQINGEQADKMEVVANRIQTYIDQARFMTVQSGEMLRKAVVQVAAARAEEARSLYPGETQAERDQRYLYAFFGRDFVDELRAMDSELLHTGNKLLSLHSMDVTSLSGALMLLALANNSSRLAILEEFDRLVKTDLTLAEQQYVQNGIGACTNGCKPGCKHDKDGPPVCFLSGNATFTSLRGFFDTQLAHDDTMSPLQREMIRLAQILKARLVTEMEYKQRVMERALIEERLESAQDASSQVQRERRAQESLVQAREALIHTRAVVLPNVAELMAVADKAESALSEAKPPLSELTTMLQKLFPESRNQPPTLQDVRTYLLSRKQGRLKAYKAQSTYPKELLPQEHIDKLYRLYRAQPPIPDVMPADIDKHIFVCVRDTELKALTDRLERLTRSLDSVKRAVAPFHGPDSQVFRDIEKVDAALKEIQLFIAAHKTRDTHRYDGFYPVATVEQITRLVDTIEPLTLRAQEFGVEVKLARTARAEFLVAFSRFEEKTTGRQTRLERATEVYRLWSAFVSEISAMYSSDATSSESMASRSLIAGATEQLNSWLRAVGELDAAYSIAQDARRPLDHKKFLDMLIDDLEEKYIELLEGTRAHTANVDNFIKRLTTALDDDFNTQFYYPAFRSVREASQFRDVQFGQTETTNVLANNRELGKVSPSATMEFDLPKRDILIEEGIDSALAIYNDVGALVNDPNLLALAKLQSGQSAATPAAGTLGGYGAVRSVYPGLDTDVSGRLINQNAGSGPEFESNVEKLIPDPAIYKFETGTGFEIRPVIAPDGQAVVFDFNYMYTTQIREPVRADEKHLGRVKQHFVDTDVQLSNFELREVSRYVVALRASRTARGVPLLEDIPVVGALWRPLPSDEKSLQENIIMAQATIFPTLFDLMGLRWAQAVSDLDPLRLSNREYLVRGRHQFLENRIYDYSSSSVDEFLRIPDENRRPDLYRSQATIPSVHPNGYRGPGLDIEVSSMREGFNPEAEYTPPGFIPSASPEGSSFLPNRSLNPYEQMPMGDTPLPVPSNPTLAPRMHLSDPVEGNAGWETKRVK